MQRIVKCSESDYEALAGIWERSVRTTHDFLDEKTVIDIKTALIPSYFPNVDLFAVRDNGTLAGFIGMRDDTIEMLFVDSDCLGQGYGSLLIDFAMQAGMTKVDVNEQNTRALDFYISKGFRVIGRDETDSDGRPYPILHMSL